MVFEYSYQEISVFCCYYFSVASAHHPPAYVLVFKLQLVMGTRELGTQSASPPAAVWHFIFRAMGVDDHELVG
jgi:hypothetical protein